MGVCTTLSCSLLISLLPSKVSWEGYVYCCSCFLIPPVPFCHNTQWRCSIPDSVDFCHKIQQQLLITLVILHFNNFQYTWISNPILNTFLDSFHVMLPFSTLLSVPFLGHLSLLELQLFRFTFSFYSTFPLKATQTEYVQQRIHDFLFFLQIYTSSILSHLSFSVTQIWNLGIMKIPPSPSATKSNQLWSPVQCKVMFPVP